MGGKLVDDLLPLNGGRVKPAPMSCSEFFREMCPYYMSIGMTYDEYWTGDCERVVYYRKAERLRKMRKNQEMWVQGMYVYDAIGAMSPVLKVHFDKLRHEPLEYTKEPYPLDAKEVRERKERIEKAKQKKMLDRMMGWAVSTNKVLSEKGDKDGRWSNGENRNRGGEQDRECHEEHEQSCEFHEEVTAD